MTSSAQTSQPSIQQPTDRFGRIEVRGIDYIPEAERHGRPRELFVVWAASNTAYFYILLGGALTQLGLNLWQSSSVVVAGNLFWGLTGLLAISGPSSGTPSSMVMRAMFGIRANRVNVALCSWSIAVAFEAINLSVGGLAAFALLHHVGWPASTALKVTVVLAIAVLTFSISIYGHATIVKLSLPLTVVLLACVLGLIGFVWPHANLHFVPAKALQGAALWAAAFVGFTMIASGPLSWVSAADYARYLPASTPSFAVAFWTALGGFVPCVLLGLTGVLAGTAIDMSDAQTSFATILPSWFYVLFLLVVILGSITNNVLTAYSSGLSLQAMGIRSARSVTVLFDGIVGMSLTLYALFVSNFFDALNNILSLSVAIMGPSLGIYAADILLRKNRYDGPALNDESSRSPYWYTGGVSWPGVLAQVGGTAVALLCVNTSVLVGPVARLCDGADFSALSGPLVAAGVYVVLARGRR